MTLDPEYHQLCTRILTPRQLEAYELWTRGNGYTTIGRILNVSKWTARDRVRDALERIERETQEAA